LQLRLEKFDERRFTSWNAAFLFGFPFDGICPRLELKQRLEQKHWILRPEEMAREKDQNHHNTRPPVDGEFQDRALPGGESPTDNVDNRNDILESILDSTKAAAVDEKLFPGIVEYAKTNQLSKEFGFETVCELVKFVVELRFGTSFDEQFKSEVVEWVSNVMYDDPFARAKTESLWNSVTKHMN